MRRHTIARFDLLRISDPFTQVVIRVLQRTCAYVLPACDVGKVWPDASVCLRSLHCMTLCAGACQKDLLSALLRCVCRGRWCLSLSVCPGIEFLGGFYIYVETHL